MYDRSEALVENARQKALWPLQVVWTIVALAGPPFLAYGLWTVLDPIIHFSGDPIGFFVPLILGTVAAWKALGGSPRWTKFTAVPIYLVCMGAFLFVELFGWACGHGRGCL